MRESEVYGNARDRLHEAITTFMVYGIFTEQEVKHYKQRISARLNMGDVKSLKDRVVILEEGEVAEIHRDRG